MGLIDTFFRPSPAEIAIYQQMDSKLPVETSQTKSHDPWIIALKQATISQKGACGFVRYSDQMIEIGFRRLLSGNDPAGIAHDHAVGRYIAIDIGIGGDQYVLTNGDISYHRCVDADPHPVMDGGRSFAGAAVFLADGYAFVQVDILSQNRLFVDSDVIRMSQIQPLPDNRISWNFNAVLIADLLITEAVPKPQKLIFTGGCFPEVITEFAAVSFGTLGAVAVHISVKQFFEAVHGLSSFQV